MDFVETLKSYSRLKTVSIAFPASIFDNTPTPQLESYLVGQIARAAVIFKVTEIVIFDEDKTEQSEARINRLVKLFEYAECPQYLRKSLFYIEPDLKFAGMIHPLEAQHHLRASQIECPYREGVTGRSFQDAKGNQQTEVNIGLTKSVVVDGQLDVNTRVTVKVDPSDLKKMNAMLSHSTPSPKALIVPSYEPIEKLNLFWGYFVRKASSLSKTLSENVFDPSDKNFYDTIIGTSERGINIDELEFAIKPTNLNISTNDGEVPKKKLKKKKNSGRHLIVVFGGVKGLEHSMMCDEDVKNCKEVSDLFHYYINTCPTQGSNTIRTEEAILITMSALRPKLQLT